MTVFIVLFALKIGFNGIYMRVSIVGIEEDLPGTISKLDKGNIIYHVSRTIFIYNL